MMKDKKIYIWKKTHSVVEIIFVCACVCVCVCERERERKYLRT